MVLCRWQMMEIARPAEGVPMALSSPYHPRARTAGTPNLRTSRMGGALSLETGLNCHISDKPGEGCKNLVTMIRRPSFTRIDLDFLVGAQEHEG
ncbi:hypothetical protein F4804DRAFT_30311 [Jackrogersella minutella]|nr:hypothetical protein F4804DRAFT_30311 [Jackrogersella minutella]